jgi:hypothetical protein
MRYRSLLAFVKAGLARINTVVEFCHDCGVRQPIVWSAPDGLWLRLVGRSGGVLCPACFDRRAQQAGLLLRWRPEILSVSGAPTTQAEVERLTALVSSYEALRVATAKDTCRLVGSLSDELARYRIPDGGGKTGPMTVRPRRQGP